MYPPPHPDPQLEGKYARPRTSRDMAGAVVVGLLSGLILLGLVAFDIRLMS